MLYDLFDKTCLIFTRVYPHCRMVPVPFNDISETHKELLHLAGWDVKPFTPYACLLDCGA